MSTINKELPIEKAEWAALHLTTFNEYQSFKNELILNGVTDIFNDNQTKIKQDKTEYIFNIKGEDKFSINASNMESWIRKYCKENETFKAQEDVLIRIKWLKIEYIKSTTQAEFDALKDEIKKLDASETNKTNPEKVKTKTSRDILFLEQEKKDIGERINKTDKIDKNLRKAYRSQIQDRLDRLYAMKSEIELLEKNQNKKYKMERETKNGKKEIKEIKMGDINDFDQKQTLKQISERLERIGDQQPDFINTKNAIIGKEGATTPYFEIAINDRKDAKALQKSLKKYNQEYIKLNALSLDATKKTELAKDLEDFEKYLNQVIADPDNFKPSEHPFVPTHKKEFFELVKKEPVLSEFLKLTWSKTEIKKSNARAEKEDKNGTGNKTETGTGAEKGKEKGNEQASSQYADYREAFEKGGVNGVSKYILDQTHMTSEQKQFWSGAGNVAVAAGGIFLGWKMLSSAYKMVFKSDKEKKTGIYDWSNLARVGIPLGLTFWLNARKGEGLTKLFTWGKLTETIAGRSEKDKETNIKLIEWFPWATALFNGLTYGEMKRFLVKDGDRIKINPNQYQELVDMFKSKKNETAVAFLENSVGKNDERHVIDLALRGMWVTLDKLGKNPDGKFNEDIAAPAIARLAIVTQRMEEKKYNKMNSETQYLVEKYIAGDTTNTLDDLEKRGDIFYKDVEIKDKTWLADRVKELAKGNIQKEKDLLLALNTFPDNMPSTKIELIGNGPEITFKTYDQESKIDFDKKTLVWFPKFDSYYEMFKAANLTNRIKFICKDKEAVKDKPFYLSAGGDITFNEADIFSTKFDTEIMTAGWGGALETVSPILEEKKQEYCDYLNTLKFWKEKPAV